MRPLNFGWELQLNFVRIRTALSPPQPPSEPAPLIGGAIAASIFCLFDFGIGIPKDCVLF